MTTPGRCWPHPLRSRPSPAKPRWRWIDHLAEQNPGDPVEADSCAMHDPLAVAVLTRPDLVEFVDAAVSIRTGDGEDRGVMIVDSGESDDPAPTNCRVARSVDADGFIAHFLGHLAGL